MGAKLKEPSLVSLSGARMKRSEKKRNDEAEKKRQAKACKVFFFTNTKTRKIKETRKSRVLDSQPAYSYEAPADSPYAVLASERQVKGLAPG